MSQTTPDGRAVVRALDALTTQVKRIADHTARGSLAFTLAADEDAQRTTRRASLHNLIVRATQGALTTDECAMLWRHVEAEQRESDTARADADRLEEETIGELNEVATRLARENEQLRADRDRLAADLEDAETRATGFLAERDQARGERDRSDEAARRALEQGQEMAEERYAWQERGDRAEECSATYQAAWHSARRRARVMSEELTRRAPLTGQYAEALARVRHLVTATAATTAAGISDYDIGRHNLATEVLAKLDGTAAGPAATEATEAADHLAGEEQPDA